MLKINIAIGLAVLLFAFNLFLSCQHGFSFSSGVGVLGNVLLVIFLLAIKKKNA